MQPAANIDQLSNRHDTQWQQLEAMRQQLAADVARLETQHEQQLQTLQSEQASLLERLQKQLTEQHAQQQESLHEHAADARLERAEMCNIACVQTSCASLPNCSAEV